MKTTSKTKIEDDLKKINGRQPQQIWKTTCLKQMEDDLNKKLKTTCKTKWMTTSKKWKTTSKKIEDNLKKNGRQPQKK
jgi:hypothetical protein